MNCFGRVHMESVQDLKWNFWSDNPPTASQRREKILDFITEAHKEYSERLRLGTLQQPDSYKKPLCFVIGGEVVCEKMFACLVGMHNKGRVLKTWVNEVDIFLGLFCV